MKKELPHYRIGSSYGGNQEFFEGLSMKMGGCAAETACECCIYLDKYYGTALYPFDAQKVTKADYREFGKIMKKYLHPRLSGVDRLPIFTDGFGRYINDKGEKITLTEFDGDNELSAAKEALKKQLDAGMPVPYLCLNHKSKRFKYYEWHWFLINGYDERDGDLFVKAVTYGKSAWLPFDKLWNTKKIRKGGFVQLAVSSMP